MDPDKLFLERCERIELLMESNEEIDVLDLSGVLRQLLFDQKSLVDTVNRNKVSIKFRVSAWPELMQKLTALTGGKMPLFASHGNMLDPEVDPQNSKVVTLSRAEFGNYPVTFWGGKAVTIKDVIKYGANVAGSIHHDPQPKPEYHVTQALSQKINMLGLPIALYHLKAISAITLRALAPLIEDVRSRRPDAAQAT